MSAFLPHAALRLLGLALSWFLAFLLQDPSFRHATDSSERRDTPVLMLLCLQSDVYIRSVQTAHSLPGHLEKQEAMDKLLTKSARLTRVAALGAVVHCASAIPLICIYLSG